VEESPLKGYQSRSKARKRLYYSHGLLRERRSPVETCMDDKDCIRIVFAKEMIITQIYENRQWAISTSVHKIAFWLQFTQADQRHDCIGTGPFHYVVHVRAIPRNPTKTSGSLSFGISGSSSMTESQFSNAVPLCFF
jgi:hypothetical protein